MKIRIVCLLIALYPLVVSAQTNSTDSIVLNYVLEGIIVKADRIIPKGDHQVIILSDKNRSFGTNALESVSSMEYFKTSINGTSLTSFDQKNVYILINGVPATGFDLRAYKGEDIKNVEYYPVAPAQYSMLTSGPVVNIVMKKRHDELYSAYINTNNAVNTGFGTNQVNLTYADSLNQVKVNYLIDYRDIRKIDFTSYYKYGNGLESSLETEKSRNYGNYQYIQTSYQRFQAKHLFNVNLKYLWNPFQEERDTKITLKDQTISSIGTGFNHLKSNNRSFVADLYYHYSFGSGRSIALNVVNTFSNTQSENTISQVLPSPYEYLNYETNSLIKNRIYSLISNVVYKTKIFGGSFSIGSRYEYLKLSQKYMDEVFTPTTNNGFVYTSMSWSKNGMTFYPSMGLSIFYQKTSAGSNQFVLPYARIYSDWWGRGKFKGFTAQLTLNVNSIKPSSGQLTNSKTSLDRYFISIGNPGLKPYWKGSANLNLAYFQPDRNNSLILQYSANYSHRPFVPILKVEENETVYLQPQIIPQVICNDVALRGTWYPISWLEISPYVEYCNSSYRTPSQDVKLNYFRMGTTLGFHKDNWALVMTANSPTKTVSGDITIGGSAQYSVDVQYKYKDWSFGARWNYLGVNDYEMGKIARFEYKENKVWKPLRTMIQLTATWTFSKGRARRQASKMLNNSSIDDGLTEKNKPSTPM